jgi:hypothetical protein
LFHVGKEEFMREGQLGIFALLLLAAIGCGDSGAKSGGKSGGGAGGGGGAGSSGGSSGGGGGGNGSNCAPSSPGSVFADALCLCGSLHDVGNLDVDGLGPASSASVGVDGISRLANHTDIGGSFSAYGGLSDAGDTTVHVDLLSSADVDVAGNLDVLGDLAAGGNLSGLGRVAVGGVLRVAGADQMIGWQQLGARGSFTPVAPPCPCDPGSLFDVAGAVAAARASSSTVILSTGPSGTIGVNPIHLTSGAYYSADAATIGYARLHVTGAVSLFVDGDLDEIGADRLVLDAGATLDLYVSGGVNTVGYAGLGDATAPASLRLYVGGASPVTLSVGAQWFHGSIYAPRANLVYVGDTNVAGGLFADELVGTGQLAIGGNLPGASGGGGDCPPTTPGQPTVTPTPPVR